MWLYVFLYVYLSGPGAATQSNINLNVVGNVSVVCYTQVWLSRRCPKWPGWWKLDACAWSMKPSHSSHCRFHSTMRASSRKEMGFCHKVRHSWSWWWGWWRQVEWFYQRETKTVRRPSQSPTLKSSWNVSLIYNRISIYNPPERVHTATVYKAM